jgi:hypothetical protein
MSTWERELARWRSARWRGDLQVLGTAVTEAR